ncbi:MAG: dTDP-4-dehydrorhamnose reductase [Patescibacteria group bacterium]
MRILIIGAKGMLGIALAEVFLDSKPLLWDREEIDVTDFKAANRKLQTAKPDVIINCAAMTDVDACEDNSKAAHALNGEAPANLALVANDLGAVLIQFSTSYIFDGRNQNGYKEDAAPMPLSVYGQSKLQGERGAAMAKKHYIIRLDRLFGKAGAGKKSFVDKMLEAARTQKQLRVIDGEEACPTYAPDLAARTRYILENKVPSGIYHATNAGACTWYGFAQAIFKIAGIGVELIPVSADAFVRKAARPKYSVLLNTKLPPARPWQEALGEYLQSSV